MSSLVRLRLIKCVLEHPRLQRQLGPSSYFRSLKHYVLARSQQKGAGIFRFQFYHLKISNFTPKLEQQTLSG